MDAPTLTDRHPFLFGSIIDWFARYERLMTKVTARLAGADFGSVRFDDQTP